MMRHTKEETTLDNRSITIYSEPDADALLLQAVDSHDMEEMEKEISYIENALDTTFTLVAIKINRWNEELTPWTAPPVFGKIPFGNGASLTLDFITGKVIPAMKQDRNFKSVILGGYSLSGLFALWSSYNTTLFDGIVAASPSVWYKDWLSYSEQNRCSCRNVYLSLGDKESHSKNKLMATVAECIERQKKILESQNVNVVMEWNEGNHFTDNGERTAKGFAWCLKSCREKSGC